MLVTGFVVGYLARETLPFFNRPPRQPDFLLYTPTLALQVIIILSMFYLSRLYHLPRVVSLLSVVWRSFRHRRRPRPDMGEGNPEKLDPAFLKWIWSYPRTRRPEILRQLEALPPTTRVVRLTSRRAMRDFLGDDSALSPSMSA